MLIGFFSFVFNGSPGGVCVKMTARCGPARDHSGPIHKRKVGNMKIRHKATGALIGFALMFGIVGAVPAMAGGSLESPPPGGELVIWPATPSELESAKSGEISPMSLSQCEIGKVCAWALYEFSGQLSWWAELPTGCKSHLNNDPVRSGFNGSRYNERIGGWGTIPSHYAWESIGGAVYGKLCWGPEY